MRVTSYLMTTVALLLLQASAADARPPRRQHASPAPARQAPGQPAENSTQQPESQTAPQTKDGAQPSVGFELYPPSSGNLIQTPVTDLFPGAASTRQPLKNPVEGNAEAIQRGMGYFNMFNCAGCHAANGGGGMGPALSNRFFIYGGAPDNIYLTIYQGRPNGMPSWGAMLPENIIWDLVSYIQSISQAPTTGWGATASHDAWKSEQLPAEFSQTATPWSQTQKFSFGQSPAGRQ